MDSLDFFALLFADDTTGLTRLSQLSDFEDDMATALREFAERLHPGKTHRLLAGRPPTPTSAFDEAVRFLGIWLQWDGKHDRDTHERLAAAQRLWNKLHPQLQRLGLTPKAKGMLIQSTVLNCLLYGCERRSFSGRQLVKYQTFLNRVTFSICSQRRRTMSEDQVTLADLRVKCGLLPVRHVIETRQLQYLGHLARLDSDRIERRILHATLWPEGDEKGIKTGPTLRQTYWKLLKQMLGDQAGDWMRIACQQDGVVWRKLLAAWDKTWAQNEKKYEWKQKHSAEGLSAIRRAAAAARAEAATGATLGPDGLYTCPHEGCGLALTLRAMRMHVSSCASLSVDIRQRRAQQRTLRQHRQPPADDRAVLRRPAAAPAQVAEPPVAAPVVPVLRRIRLNGKQAPPADYPRTPQASWPMGWLQSWSRYHRSSQFLVKARMMSTTDLPCPRHAAREAATCCIWCQQHFASSGKCSKHMRCCTGMTYDNWLYRIRFLQREVSTTTFKRPHCQTAFSLAKACGRHSVQCKKRRQISALPLNTKLWHDIDMEQIRV
eukprot:s3945_g2.t1